MLLTDGYIANAAEPWKVPDPDPLAPFPVTSLTDVPEGGFLPYARDDKGARPWVKPGAPGLLHRIGGIEAAIAAYFDGGPGERGRRGARERYAAAKYRGGEAMIPHAGKSER